MLLANPFSGLETPAFYICHPRGAEYGDLRVLVSPRRNWEQKLNKPVMEWAKIPDSLFPYAL